MPRPNPRLHLLPPVLALSLAPVLAGAAPARPAPVKRAPALPALTRLVVLPPEVVLDGPLAEQRLVVMGVRADGARADVTAGTSIVSAGPKVAAAAGDRLRARGDGRTTVLVKHGALSVRLPVTVKNAARPVNYSFRNDVVPVLARLGCSSGTCHGANSGKGGFKLSLRGYAPEQDFLSITRELGGRRISREAPERSLLLRKPLMEVPHAGGRALEKGSREYFALLGWLLQGAPPVDEKDPALVRLELLPGDRVYRPRETQRLLVRATYADGRVTDVTDRAVFRSTDTGVAAVSADGELTAANPGSTAVQAKYMDLLAVVRVTVPFPQKVNPAAFPRPVNFVDEAVHAKLRELNLEPSGPCTDEEFLRRAYLDVLGTLPTPEEARAFLADSRPDKRDRLIDDVLQRPEYGSIWALRLADVFMVRKEHMGRKNTLALNQWLTEQFQNNRPWDQVVKDLVTATGAVTENPATLWWASRQATRPNARGWVRSYELTAETTAQVFLGQRIQCAKCHNHPTERHTQDDYYRFAAVFAQVNGDGPADPIPARFLPNEPGEVRHPRSGQVVPAAAFDRVAFEVKQGEDRRLRFAEWLTGAGQDLFARNAANRVWARLFGDGIVSPVDDLSLSNPPRNEALLDGLARELVARKYDLKALMRTIMRSRTYQATSAPTARNRIDSQFFSRYPVRRLPAEELMDALAQVTGVPDRFASYPVGTRAIELSDTELTIGLLDTFGRPNRTTPCECDRGTGPTLSQALELFNGEALQGKIKSGDGRLSGLVRAGKKDPEIVEELFLAAFARRPSEKELADCLRAVAAAPNREEGLQDVLWALLNSKEFMFNH